MWDLFYVVLTAVFFAVGAAFARGCELLEREEA